MRKILIHTLEFWMQLGYKWIMVSPDKQGRNPFATESKNISLRCSNNKKPANDLESFWIWAMLCTQVPALWENEDIFSNIPLKIFCSSNCINTLEMSTSPSFLYIKGV